MKRAELQELQRKADLWDAINIVWRFPGKKLEDVLRQYAEELVAAKSNHDKGVVE